jgi:PAS domain S-box-containing protein
MNVFVLSANEKSRISLAINKAAKEQKWTLHVVSSLDGIELPNDFNLLVVDATEAATFDCFYKWHTLFVESATHFVKTLILVDQYQHQQAGKIIPFHNVTYVLFPDDYQQLLTHLNFFIGFQNGFKETALVSRNTIYGRVVDSIALVSITDAHGNIIYANERFCQVSGYSKSELIGRDHSIVKSGVHTDKFYAALWSKIRSGEVWKGYFCNLSKSGDNYWVDSVIYPIKDPNDVIQQYVSIRYEVTELINVKNKLQLSEERFRISHQYAGVGTWDWNIKTGEIYWSDEVHKLFGFDEPVLETSYGNFLGVIHPQDRESVVNSINGCLRTGEPFSFEHRVIWPGGEIRWLSERGHVIFDDQGTPVRMLGVVSDIHELREAKDKAQAADKLKSDFISTLSHEIRNPINAIIGYARLIDEMTSNGSKQYEFATKIKQIGLHVSGILDDVALNMTLEAGNFVKEISKVSLEQVIEQVMNIAEMKDSDVDITIETVTGNVLADEQSLRQVLLNLLNNAMKYNRPHGHAYIRVLVRKNGITRIEVEDTGFGIAEDDLDKLFTPFERLGMAGSEVDGMGLGLSICKYLVEGMSGTIGVSSQVDLGSIFWIELPSAEPSSTTVEHRLSSSSKALSLEQKNLPKKVLLVEDNVFNQDFIQLQLNRLGIDVDIAGNGLEGLLKLDEENYDLILTDQNMPKMDGLEFVMHVRQHESDSIKYLPVVIISADRSRVENFKYKESINFLFKPFTQDSLVSTLSSANSQHKVVLPDEKAASSKTVDVDNRVIDTNLLHQYLGTEQQQVNALVLTYVKLLSGNVSALQQSSQPINREKLKSAAHRLASSSLSVGAKSFSDDLKQIELHALTESEDELAKRVALVLLEAEKVESALTALLNDANIADKGATVENNPDTVKLLIIDDDPFALQQIKQQLDKVADVQYVCVEESMEGLTLIKQSGFDIVILDIDMPSIDGIQFVRLLSDFYNDETLVLYSGAKALVNSTAELIKTYGFNYVGAIDKPATESAIATLLASYKANKGSHRSKVNSVSDGEIRSLIENDQIEVLYQPQISVKSKQVVSVEALSRLKRNKGSLVPPFLFLHRLNELQLESTFAIKVSEIAIEQLAQWHAQDYAFNTAINFSMFALEDLSLPDKLVYMCEQRGIDPEFIVVEITESDISNEPKHALEVISRLKLAGFQLSIDDFGTGFSSMDKLQRLPFNELKLDKSYVLNANDDTVSRALLTSSLGLAQKLKMSTVAEGVETKAVFDLIEAAGADFAQGYYFAKPLPAAELIAWIGAFRVRKEI